MRRFRPTEELTLAEGRVEGQRLEVLRRALAIGGTLDRKEADYLVQLRRTAPYRTPGFEQFFYQAIKDHLLAGGRIGADETAWLRQALFAGGPVDDEGRQRLHQLKAEARQVGPEFEALLAECPRPPAEQPASWRAVLCAGPAGCGAGVPALPPP